MIYLKISCYLDFSGISSKALASLVAQMVKNPPAVWETWILSPGWEDPPGEGNSYPLKYSCLENSIDRGAWQVTVHGVAKESDMTERLSLHFTSLQRLYFFPHYTNGYISDDPSLLNFH